MNNTAVPDASRLHSGSRTIHPSIYPLGTLALNIGHPSVCQANNAFAHYPALWDTVTLDTTAATAFGPNVPKANSTFAHSKETQSLKGWLEGLKNYLETVPPSGLHPPIQRSSIRLLPGDNYSIYPHSYWISALVSTSALTTNTFSLHIPIAL